MKCLLFTRSVDDPPQLYIQAETVADRAILEVLMTAYQLTGIGRDLVTMEPLHVMVELEEKA